MLLERFTVSDWHEHMLRYRPQISGLPPAGVQMVLDADIPRADLASIRSLGTGAAPLDPTTHRAFEERYANPDIALVRRHGICRSRNGDDRGIACPVGQAEVRQRGRAIAGAQLRAIDPDTGELLPPGQEGILEVSGSPHGDGVDSDVRHRTDR